MTLECNTTFKEQMDANTWKKEMLRVLDRIKHQSSFCHGRVVNLKGLGPKLLVKGQRLAYPIQD